MTATTAATGETIGTRASIPCEPWCVYKDGSGEEACMGPSYRTPASLYPRVLMGDDGYADEWFEVYAYASRIEPWARDVQLSLGGATALRMTADEARRVAAHLIRAASELDGR